MGMGGAEFEFPEPKKSQAQADNPRKMGDRGKRMVAYTVENQSRDLASKKTESKDQHLRLCSNLYTDTMAPCTHIHMHEWMFGCIHIKIN